MIHYESVGGAGGGTIGGQGFFTAEYAQLFTAAGSTHELLFDDPDGFYSNDPASFTLDGAGRVNILQAGGYQLVASMKVSGLRTDTGMVAEIAEIRGVDAAAHNEYGVVGEPPITAFLDQQLLPGATGYNPLAQYLNFYNLQDGYAYGGPRPVSWPLVIHLTMAWTAGVDHNVTYSLTGTRHT